MDVQVATSLQPPLQDRIDALPGLQYVNPRQGLLEGLHLRREALAVDRPVAAAWACQHASVCAARLQRYGLASRLNREATDLFGQQGEQLGLVTTENLRGILAQEQAKFRDAYTHFHNVMLSSQEYRFLEMYGKALNNLSLAAQSMGDLDAALDWSLQSLTFSEEHGNQETYAMTLINRVNLYMEVGHVDAACKAAEEGVTAARKLNRPAIVATTLNNLSVALHRKGHHERALMAAEESLAIECALGPGIGVAYARTQIGRLQMELQRYPESQASLFDARQLTAGSADPALELEVLTLLGLLHTRLSQWSEAREWLEQAEHFARAGREDEGLRVALEARAALEEAAGNFPEALRTFKRFHDLDRRASERKHNQRTEALLLTHEIREHRRLNEELTAANAHLMHVANHDSLTGSLNRRAFVHSATQRLLERGHHSVVLVDIDHFKRINDTFGHQSGDEVLKQMVQLITGCIREGDLLCRWGGEEFILLLPNTTPQQAVNTCERLREQLHLYPWPIGRPVTASFGVSGNPSTDLDVLVSEADLALYQAKAEGRDRVRLFDPARQHVKHA